MNGDKLGTQLQQHDTPAHPSEEQWRKIEAAVGKNEPDDAFRRRIQDCYTTSRRLELTFGDRGGPQLTEVRKLLEKVLSLAKTMGEFHKIDVACALNLLIEHSLMPVEDEPLELWGSIELQQANSKALSNYERNRLYRPSQSKLPFETETLATSVVSDLTAASEAALALLPKSKGGKPKSVRKHALICNLATLFLKETGELPKVKHYQGSPSIDEIFSGPFMTFVEAVFAAFHPEYSKSNEALGQKVKRSLKVWTAQMAGDKTQS